MSVTAPAPHRGYKAIYRRLLVTLLLMALTPLVALGLSFMASAGSFAAFAIMFVGMTVLLFLAALPFGLGLLVWVPMSLLLPVVGYRSLFAAHA